MSLEAMVWALKQAPVQDPVAKLVLIGLADHASSDGTAAWPSQATLAVYAGVTERSVRNKLTVLEGAGLIRRGDQTLLHRLPPNRRPVVWDLRMSESWEEPGSPQTEDREEPGSPLNGSGGNLTHLWGESDDSSGGNAVSDKPSLEPSLEPKEGTPPPAPSPKRSLRPLPPDWQPTEKHGDEAARLGLNVSQQATMFRNSALANDRRYKNWDAAFSNWLIRSVQYAGKPVKQEKPRSYLYGEA